jgi:hypothetical protein
MATEQLVQLLYATLDANPGVRAQGESGLVAGAAQPGFGLALARVSTSPEYPYGVRQLAGLVLRKYVKVRVHASPPPPLRSVCHRGELPARALWAAACSRACVPDTRCWSPRSTGRLGRTRRTAAAW